MRCGGSDFLFQEKLKPAYLEGLPEKMKQYSQYLGKRPWFAGDKVMKDLHMRGMVICPNLGLIFSGISAAYLCGFLGL